MTGPHTYSTSTTEGFISPPAVSRELLGYLKQVFPDRLPENIFQISDRELGALVGKQMIIRHLEVLLHQQEEDMIDTNVP